jgi:hypothetical protein
MRANEHYDLAEASRLVCVDRQQNYSSAEKQYCIAQGKKDKIST